MTSTGSPVDPDWQLVGVATEADRVEVRGVNLWDHEWVATGDEVMVAHPQHPTQRHTMMVYELSGADGPVAFAAGELSNGVWGFFVRE